MPVGLEPSLDPYPRKQSLPSQRKSEQKQLTFRLYMLRVRVPAINRVRVLAINPRSEMKLADFASRAGELSAMFRFGVKPPSTADEDYQDNTALLKASRRTQASSRYRCWLNSSVSLRLCSGSTTANVVSQLEIKLILYLGQTTLIYRV